MLSIVADARDNAPAPGCMTCCCTPVSVRPGETNQVLINYAPWVAPLGGRGLQPGTVFSLEKVSSPPVSPTNLPPVVTDYAGVTSINTPLVGTLTATDPEAGSLTFAWVPPYATRYGALQLAPNGAFTYTPSAGYVGYDEFTFSVKDSVNAPVLRRARITVNAASPTPALPAPVVLPVLHVPPGSVQVHPHHIKFPLHAAPELAIGDIWRMTILQNAFDCNDVYTHRLCLDIAVGKC